MNELQELTNELMRDVAFRKEYEALQPERDITMSLIRARKETGLTQAELSEKTGISQAESADWRMAQEIPVWRY